MSMAWKYVISKKEKQVFNVWGDWLLFLLGPNPKGWGPIGLGCPSVCLSVCPSYFFCTG